MCHDGGGTAACGGRQASWWSKLQQLPYAGRRLPPAAPFGMRSADRQTSSRQLQQLPPAMKSSHACYRQHEPLESPGNPPRVHASAACFAAVAVANADRHVPAFTRLEMLQRLACCAVQMERGVSIRILGTLVGWHPISAFACFALEPPGRTAMTVLLSPSALRLAATALLRTPFCMVPEVPQRLRCTRGIGTRAYIPPRQQLLFSCTHHHSSSSSSAARVVGHSLRILGEPVHETPGG